MAAKYMRGKIYQYLLKDFLEEIEAFAAFIMLLLQLSALIS